MTAKLKCVAWGCLAMVCGSVSAQIRDGAYTGTIDCGPLITNPQQGAWSQPVQLTVCCSSLSHPEKLQSFSVPSHPMARCSSLSHPGKLQ